MPAEVRGDVEGFGGKTAGGLPPLAGPAADAAATAMRCVQTWLGRPRGGLLAGAGERFAEALLHIGEYAGPHLGK